MNLEFRMVKLYEFMYLMTPKSLNMAKDYYFCRQQLSNPSAFQITSFITWYYTYHIFHTYDPLWTKLIYIVERPPILQ